MADFNTAVQQTLKFEGGYSNNPADKGNYYNGILVGTNYGVSAPVLAQYLGRTPSVDDMKNLTQQEAIAIYKRGYWDPLGADNIQNESVAGLLFDTAVNMGLGTTAKLVSDTLKINATIPFTSTVNVINAQDQNTFFNNFKNARAQKYEAIGGIFLSGWLNRLNSITFQDIKNNLPMILIVVMMMAASVYILTTNKT